MGKACREKGRQVTGHCALTPGFALAAKHVIHAVGPSGNRPALLANCYRSVLDCAMENSLRSVALCCISTGIFGFPNESATRTAVKSVREWFEEDKETRIKAFDAVIFCVYDTKDLTLYRKYLPSAFPQEDVTDKDEIRDIDSGFAAATLAPKTDAESRKRANEIEVADEKALEDRRKAWRSGGGRASKTGASGYGRVRKPKKKEPPTTSTGEREANIMSEGQRVYMKKSGAGVIRFVGRIDVLPLGWWIGVELDDAVGKNDGEVKGSRIFNCPKEHGLFVRPARIHFLDEDDAAELSALRRTIFEESLKKDIKEEPHKKAQEKAAYAAKMLFAIAMVSKGHPRGF